MRGLGAFVKSYSFISSSSPNCCGTMSMPQRVLPLNFDRYPSITENAQSV
jgi:hypothetical protein